MYTAIKKTGDKFVVIYNHANKPICKNIKLTEDYNKEFSTWKNNLKEVDFKSSDDIDMVINSLTNKYSFQALEDCLPVGIEVDCIQVGIICANDICNGECGNCTNLQCLAYYSKKESPKIPENKNNTNKDEGLFSFVDRIVKERKEKHKSELMDYADKINSIIDHIGLSNTDSNRGMAKIKLLGIINEILNKK